MRHETGQAIVEYLVIAGAIMAVILSWSGVMNAKAASLIDRAGQELMSPSATADGLMP